jgi:phosphoribosylaminoimidazolecarboxamide formyltransferase/IMP cyclohydrolase
MNALISVSNKKGIIEFARELVNLGVTLIATEGTKKYLEEKGISCKGVQEVTGSKELLGGRVKSLHPKIVAGILAERENEKHMKELEEISAPVIDIVVCNLYPFQENPSIENIDIGGVTLIRAGAKNYKYVTCITSPNQYPRVIEEIKTYGKVSDSLRFELAQEAFKLTMDFDTKVVNYFNKEIFTLKYEKLTNLRYGENPHQKAIVYKQIGYNGVSLLNAKKLQGKELSFNNYYDIETVLYLMKSYDKLCVAIIKHGTPSSVALGCTPLETYLKALKGDSISPFGGIMGINGKVDEKLAKELSKIFLTCVISFGYDEEARKILKKKKNLILLEIERKDKLPTEEYRWISGGMLWQERDEAEEDRAKWECVTKVKPTPIELEAMEFGVKVVRYVKSNAVIIVSNDMTLGIGGGQPNRVKALEIAIQNMRKFKLEQITPKVGISDGFFPFRDSIDLLAEAGIKVVLQPGGSIRDKEIISACNEHKISMVFSHRRYFRH